MTIKSWLLLCLTILVACASPQSPPEDVVRIKSCIDALARHNSPHTDDGHLTAEWSIAQTRTFDESDFAFVFFKGSLPTRPPNVDYIDDRLGIICSVSGRGNVVELISPEYQNGRQILYEYITDDGAAEDKAFKRLGDLLRTGAAIHAKDSIYQISGANIAPLGETEISKLDPEDFSSL